MDEDLGKHDAGWDGGFSSRTEWVVGLDERGLCQQFGWLKRRRMPTLVNL